MPEKNKQEREAVRTTIVGGRPPGCGKDVGPIPRGIEVLLKKAKVDDAFREKLIQERAGAAREIGLRLDPAEEAMLDGVPAPQLEAIVERTRVAAPLKKAFLTGAATVMLAALGTSTLSCDGEATRGVQPDRPGGRGADELEITEVEGIEARLIGKGSAGKRERAAENSYRGAMVTQGMRVDRPPKMAPVDIKGLDEGEPGSSDRLAEEQFGEKSDGADMMPVDEGGEDDQ